MEIRGIDQWNATERRTIDHKDIVEIDQRGETKQITVKEFMTDKYHPELSKDKKLALLQSTHWISRDGKEIKWQRATQPIESLIFNNPTEAASKTKASIHRFCRQNPDWTPEQVVEFNKATNAFDGKRIDSLYRDGKFTDSTYSGVINIHFPPKNIAKENFGHI
ncbi:hypothetical protein F9K50_09025 [bacterium]|nr:MAG: hypothetical protein F9K50_09025 [bacterium]